MNWATLQNTPFQYFKHYTEEGGISTPLIAYWPKGIDPKLDGGFVRAPGHLIDVMPTLVEISGATYPKTFHGHDIVRSEEHKSELTSLMRNSYAVFCLEKKNTHKI